MYKVRYTNINPFCFKLEKPTIKLFNDILIASKLLQLFRHPKLCTNQQWMAFMSSKFFRHLLMILLCFFCSILLTLKQYQLLTESSPVLIVWGGG